jgi:hypothetical protein
MAKRKDGAGDMARDFKAISEAMDRDRKKNPPLGSPAWARQQAEKAKGK